MVLHVSPVHAIEYYDTLAEDVGRLVDRAKRALIRGRRARETRRDGLGYYDHGAEEGVGTFQRLCRGDPDPRSLFAGLDTGTVAETTVIRRIADRRHPRTGRKLLLRHQKRWLKDVRKHAKKVVGHDIQLNAIKDLSVLWAFASPPLRALLAAAHHRAVVRALSFIRENGLIESRSGQDGRRREPVADALIAGYFHTLSRANDAHLHTHFVLMNLCRRGDGSIGAVDTSRIVAFGSALTELYRAELAAILHRELGLEVRKEEHGFSLPAIPKAVVTLFSKRRIAIEEEAEARGFEPGKDRKAAQNVSRDTRRSKAKGVTADGLLAGWKQEARQIGHEPDSFMLPIEAAISRHTPSLTRPDPLASHDPDRLLETAFARDARLSWPNLLAHVARQVQIEANADEAIALAEALRARVIELPGHDHGEPVYTSAAIIRAEHDLLKRAVEGRSRWTKLTASQVEAALKAFPTLSNEQRGAVRHALNRDRVCVVNGSAGSGKSFMSFSIARVAEHHGLRVIGTSAAWTAAQVLRREAGLSTDNTFSLAKLMAEIGKGRLLLNEHTVIIVDEAGMAPLDVIADLVRMASEAKAKIVLVGDVRQLQPVASGAPMRALASELGFAEMVAIRRQRHDWMRIASVELAAHRPDQAVDAYDRAGCVAVHVDREGTLDAAADDYVRQAADDTAADALGRQLLITPRNRDVAALNERVRNRLQATGQLGPDLVQVKALPRGKREGSEPITIPLAVGDRIIFGARLELRSRTIFNSDVARILAIDSDVTDPRLTFVLDRGDDDGQPLSFMVRYSELVSRFSNAGVPELQHAYAMTVHASQGATVERAVLVDVEGLSAEASYVGMTRHRDGLLIHLSAEKSLSRHRREVFRVSKRNELIDDEAPDRATVTLTKQERDAAVALAKARMRRPQADPNPSFHVFDKAAWLASNDPVEEFQRQITRRGGRGGIGRMMPKAPETVASGDATVLSKAEMARLDAIPLTSEPVRTAFQLSAVAPSRLHHDGAGIAITLTGNLPDWSADQRQALARCRAAQDHPLVQMAILLLKKPLRWARAWVRRSFGLRGLNPLAAAAHAEDRRIREHQDTIEGEAPRRSPSFATTPEIADREMRRQRQLRRWGTLAEADAQQAAEHAAGVENQERAARRLRRFEQWAARDAEAARHSPLSSVPEQSPETAAATELAPLPPDRHQADSVVKVESNITPSPYASFTAPAQDPDVVVEAPSRADGRPSHPPRLTPDDAHTPTAPRPTASVVTAPAPDVTLQPPTRRPAPRASTYAEMIARVETSMIAHEILPTLPPSRQETGSRPLADRKQPTATAEVVRETHARQQTELTEPWQPPDRLPETMASADAKPLQRQPQLPTAAPPSSPGHPKPKRKRFWPRIRKRPDRDRE